MWAHPCVRAACVRHTEKVGEAGKRPERQYGMCALTYLIRLGVYLCVGLLLLLRGCIALEFGLVSFGLHCFLRLSDAGLIVVLLPGRCWACSAFYVSHGKEIASSGAPTNQHKEQPTTQAGNNYKEQCE